MENKNANTAAWASIDDIGRSAAAVDARVTEELSRVMAQRRSVEVAHDYVRTLGSGGPATCWSLAEAAGHEGWHRMQALLSTYQWDWKTLRGQLPDLARDWMPHDPHDPIGPGIAIDETAHLKRGDHTAAVAPQHAGCTGKVENCVTTVFSAYVTNTDQAWVDWDTYLPQRWADDPERCRQAGIPAEVTMTTKPELAIDQITRLLDSGLPIAWAAVDEVYGRSGTLRRTCEQRHLVYVAIVPCSHQITTTLGTTVRVDSLIGDAVFERRSAGPGSAGGRYADWALIATDSPEHHILIRRLISRPDQYTFYLCYAPVDRQLTLTHVIMIAGRRWPVERTFSTGKGVLGWDTSQVRTWRAQGRHTALVALAQLSQIAVRAHLHGHRPPGDTTPHSQGETKPHQDTLPAGHPLARPVTAASAAASAIVTDADLRIPLEDAPIPAHADQPRPRHLGLIRLSVTETARLVHLAHLWGAGLISRARLAFALRWSTRRRGHQATARWYHHVVHLRRI